MTLQDIEQLLTTRKLEIFKKALGEIHKKPLSDREKFYTFLILCEDNRKRADKCLKVLSENDFSDLEDFAKNRIIDAFAYAATLHMEEGILLLKEAKKLARTEEDTKTIEMELTKEEKRLENIRETFNEALQEFREGYTALLGNEQVILDASLSSELGEYL